MVLRRAEGERQVLLIFRKGVWDLPKGKKEPGEAIEACALREVTEETGIDTLTVEHFLTKTYHQYERDGKLYKKETHWFAMRAVAETNFTPQKEEGITKVQWIEIRKAIQMAGYENLLKVLELIK